MRKLLSTLVLAGCAGCGTQVDGARAGSVTPLPSPAGVGSGEAFVSSTGDAAYMSWIEASPGTGHDVWVARMDEGGWGPRRLVAHGEDFFVNWADFPAVLSAPDGTLWVHWLEREEGPGLAYGIRVSRSTDAGETWSEPWTPHEDGTPTEHGFVSLFPFEDGVGLVWLDGRKYAPAPDGSPATREMTVRFRRVSGGTPGSEVLLDDRACDCCQTDVALASAGPVVVYRNRTEGEIRDVHVARFVSGRWTESQPVHEDGWVIAGCPVNGPAVAARGTDVAVAWFTAPGNDPRVLVARSGDGGATFGAPTRADEGNPAGRVDLVMHPDGGLSVVWLERTGGDAAEVLLRSFDPDGSASRAITITPSSSARASGFPRMAPVPWAPNSVLVAWTDVSGDEGSRVSVATVEVPGP